MFLVILIKYHRLTQKLLSISSFVYLFRIIFSEITNKIVTIILGNIYEYTYTHACTYTHTRTRFSG